MRNKLLLFFLVETISKISYACYTEPTPEELARIKIMMYLKWGGILFLGLFIAFLIVKAVQNRRKVQITFKENGKIIKEIFNLVSLDKQKIVFENKNYRYECKTSEIIKLKRKNVWFERLIVFSVIIAILLLGNYILYDLTITNDLSMEAEGCF